MRARVSLIIIMVGLGLLVGLALAAFTKENTPAYLGEKILTPQTEKRYVIDDYNKEWYENVFRLGATSTREPSRVKSGVLPHHLVAARSIAAFFSKLEKQEPLVVAVIGPNHGQVGPYSLVTSRYVWDTPYGDLKPDKKIIGILEERGIVVADESITDNSINALLPFIKRTWPKAKIVPILVKNKTSTSSLNALSEALAENLPEKSLVLASIDFSHYLPSYVADYHDELALNVLRTGDAGRISNLEIDSQPSLYALLRYNELKKARHFDLVAHTNSALLAGQPGWTETTSHLTGYFTDGNADSRKTISIQFFGDMMLERNVAKAMGNEGLSYLFGKIAATENRFFSGQDLIIANLEGPFAPSRIETSKEIAFRFDPKLGKQLADYGFDAFSLANNHTFDMGSKNALYTQKILSENGLGYFGNQYQENNSSLWIAESDSLSEKVALLGFNTTDHAPRKEDLIKLIDAAKKESRYVIVYMHWGHEYERESDNSQRHLARWLIDNGATAIIGAHPHVIQEMEMYKGRPIFYSLGNFIFDQYFSQETQEGYSVGLILADGKVVEAHLFPFFGKRSQVSLMSGVEREKFLDWMNKKSRLEGKMFVGGKLDL